MTATTDQLLHVAKAFLKEYELWGRRYNKGEKQPFEVYRETGSDIAGDFSELHSFKTLDDADRWMFRHQRIAAAQKAVEAMP